ncbi:MAG: putative sulfate exporter family transporter, partial [Bacteroidales bacterium]|nr:putative sulfate exporter family transporter [Bacteroidales bacterium]
LYTGATLHEVAHVVGAGNAMGAEIQDTATIVKMIRVIMLVPVLLVLAFTVRPKEDASVAQPQARKGKIAVPWFAFIFLLVIGFNSLNIVPSACIGYINAFDTFLLTMAMTALGTETSFDKFKKAGPRPFLLAFLLYIWLFFGGYALTRYLAPLI